MLKYCFYEQYNDMFGKIWSPIPYFSSRELYIVCGEMKREPALRPEMIGMSAPASVDF